jgi:hypothetical protein
MNLQIHHVTADITGASGVAIVEAILAGQRDPNTLAALGDKRLKANKATLAAALTGDYREEYLFCLKQACEGHAFTLKQIAGVDAQLEAMHKALEQSETPCEKPQKPKARPRCGCPAGYDAGKLLGAHLGVDLTTIPAINASTAQTRGHFEKPRFLQPPEKSLIFFVRSCSGSPPLSFVFYRFILDFQALRTSRCLSTHLRP